ncbi:hypothetical protein GWI33_007601 [Rhynchophorus ferrugineus]|uniref:Uncharacterized protein n=1 Tax=Rhynchophorus ferrugineus TaxID=354439 RepID=A0A834MI75_RHYFE|nr:hypothetical protein GWI33_007601 [Rhynchophorus ferrugineus]
MFRLGAKLSPRKIIVIKVSRLASELGAEKFTPARSLSLSNPVKVFAKRRRRPPTFQRFGRASKNFSPLLVSLARTNSRAPRRPPSRTPHPPGVFRIKRQPKSSRRTGLFSGLIWE